MTELEGTMREEGDDDRVEETMVDEGDDDSGRGNDGRGGGR